jgi:HAD superfamily hydrolase (TIGR01509 family)
MEQFKQKFKAIIFDMDGTIIQTEHIWHEGTLIYLEEYKITDCSQPHIQKFVASLVGHSEINVARHLKKYFNLPASLQEIIAQRVVCIKKALEKLATEKPCFLNGFHEFHAALRAHNIPSGIATNATIDGLMHYADQLDFHSMFGKHLYSISHVDLLAKPDPAVFLHAAKQLGVDPSECIVFEDSYAGFIAAKAAGMKCVAIQTQLNGEHLHLTHASIKDYHDAMEALEILVNKE